jgi:MFS family permease
LAESWHLLRTRRFGTFSLASFLSNLGTWAQQVAEPWLLLSLGASSFLIGLDSFAMAAPAWILTLIGGILADRSDRRRVIATCQSIQMLCPALLVALLLSDAVQPWMVILLSVVVGVTDALSMPSFQTIVPSIVEPDRIPAALALNATQFNLSRIIGPAIAGIVMAGVGAVGCFALNAVSYLPFIWVALWVLPRGNPVAAVEGERGHFFAGIAEILRTPHLRGALLTVLLSSTLCGPLIVFCPVLVKNVLHGDVKDFSLSIGAFGIGGLLGAVALLGVAAGRDRRRLSSWFALTYGLLVIAVALNPWFWGLPVLLALAGLAMTVTDTSANSLLQASAVPDLRGETISLYMLALRGGVSVGSLVTGASVSLLGARQALLINGLIAVVAQFAVGREWFRSSLPAPGTGAAG